ncbi:uncharacterized protein LOC117887364 isoform X1 [Trachemys scripta elegans]|uniref:uncharacterized protein LOC117887364 isoform X1 n=1 Tax=Trachemys scripta elegans TaxID=31138 RepID=UPI001554C30D|nr:uncharacterized protein LOC117887364 isoform X1 [Trachemys scripta elegans]
MSLPAKRCGRPPVLSCLEKKKRKQSLDRRRGKTRIYVGNHIDRWLTLKEKLDFRNDAEVAGFLLDLYDNYDPLSKASICSLPEDVRRITVKGERELPDDTSLIAADGTYDNDDQLSKESTCSGPEDVRIITVKEERDLPDDCSTETDDTNSISGSTYLYIPKGSGVVLERTDQRVQYQKKSDKRLEQWHVDRQEDRLRFAVQVEDRFQLGSRHLQSSAWHRNGS